ncbi:hypothetical protein CapIbe_022949, partial [Capra ibex]
DSHPLQWLVTTTVTCAPLPVTAPARTLVRQLFLREVHSPIHGHSVGVPRALRVCPGFHQH